MASLALAFDILARDRASKEFDKVGGSAEKASKRVKGAFGGLGKTLVAGFAGIATVSVFKGFIDEAEESRKVGRLTAQVIKSTGGAARLSAKQVGDLATAISNKTGVDDEAIQSGENLLLTFTNIRNEAGKGNDIFSQATSILTDMSVALGQDTKSSAIQLGKALNDPIKGVTALQRVGVSFTEQQKEQIKTLVDSGRTLDAQKLVLRELGKEFGGAAAAAATPTQKLQVAFGNLKEAIGTALLPVVDHLASFLTTVALPAISNLGKVIGPVAKRVTDALSGIFDFLVKGDFSAAFGRAFGLEEDSPVVDKLFTFRDSVISVVGKISAAFGGIGAAIQAGLDAFVPDATKLAGNIASGLAGAASTLIDGVRQGLDNGNWAPLGKSIASGLAAALNGAGEALGALTNALGKMLGKIDWVGIGIAVGKQAPAVLVGIAAGLLNFDLMGLLKGLAKHWQDVLVAVIIVAFAPAKLLGKVSEALARVPLAGRLLKWGFDAFVKFSKGLRKAVEGFAGDLVRAISRGLFGREAAVSGAIRGFFSNVITAIYVHADDFLKAGLSLMGRLRAGILKGVEVAFGALRGVAGKVAGALGRELAAEARAGVSLLGTVWERLTGLLLRPLEAARGGLSRVFGGIRSVLSNALSGLLGLVRGAWSRVTSLMSTPIQAAVRSVSGAFAVLRSVVAAAVRPLAGAFEAVGSAGSRMWTSVLRPALRALASVWLTVVGALVTGAAKAFGWVPGIGGKLKNAAAEFNKFKDKVNASIDGITPSKTVTVGIVTRKINTATLAGQQRFAVGGYVSGPGTGTSDSINALLSNGEFVMSAAATKRFRSLLEDMNSGRPIRPRSLTSAATMPSPSPSLGDITVNVNQVGQTDVHTGRHVVRELTNTMFTMGLR